MSLPKSSGSTSSGRPMPDPEVAVKELLPMEDAARRGSACGCDAVSFRYLSSGSSVNTVLQSSCGASMSGSSGAAIWKGTSSTFRLWPGSKGHAEVEGSVGLQYSRSSSKRYCTCHQPTQSFPGGSLMVDLHIRSTSISRPLEARRRAFRWLLVLCPRRKRYR